MPQDSILGPLFNSYIFDLVNIEDSISYNIYTYDASIFFSGVETNNIMCDANSFLTKLGAWAISKSLQVNVGKTKAVLFRSRNKHCYYTNMPSLGTCAIDIVDNVNVLGAIFSQHMAWDEVVQHTCKELSTAVRIMYKYRYIIPS